jgi:hypothetical protein
MSYEGDTLLMSAAHIASRAAALVKAAHGAPARAFLRSFREAMSRASVSVGGVSISFDAQRERAESPLRSGHISTRRG